LKIKLQKAHLSFIAADGMATPFGGFVFLVLFYPTQNLSAISA